MQEIGIGIVGGGYMGKAHSVAFASVGAVFNMSLRPRLEMICATTAKSAEGYRAAYGFARATADWRELVNDPKVDAVVIASPQSTHRDIAEAAFAAGKHVLCEKPLAETVEDSKAMVHSAETSGLIHMIGFNYVRTPATQFVRQLLRAGELGRIVMFRGEHSEDFHADPDTPMNWRSRGMANGNLGDLAPHVFNMALALMGPIDSLNAEIETVHKTRMGENGPEEVTNDDQLLVTCRFASGVLGSLFSSRVATGRKMGYAYEITGTVGAIRFDGEDQNAVWLYKTDDTEGQRGFRKILTGPEHPDYLPFCQGPGHGTGYQDQIIIEAKDFLNAIADGKPAWPTFRDGLAVAEVCDAVWKSSQSRQWVKVVPAGENPQ